MSKIKEEKKTEILTIQNIMATQIFQGTSSVDWENIKYSSLHHLHQHTKIELFLHHAFRGIWIEVKRETDKNFKSKCICSFHPKFSITFREWCDLNSFVESGLKYKRETSFKSKGICSFHPEGSITFHEWCE